jgi:hypothetical protein
MYKAFCDGMALSSMEEAVEEGEEDIVLDAHF